MRLNLKNFRVLLSSLALVSIIPFIFFFESKSKETTVSSRRFSAEFRVIRAAFEFERNDSLIILDEVSVRNSEGLSRSRGTGIVLNGGVPTKQSKDLNAEISDLDLILDPLDPVFEYLSEDKLLTLQFDFFLNVTLNPAHQLNQLLTPPVELSNIRKMEKGWFGTNLYDLSVILPNRENRKHKPDASSASFSQFRMNRIDFDFALTNLKRSERSLISFKFHRYFALLFSFPPNSPEGQNETC
ncbi:hypothetical protein LEP1GSC193_0035 [Leptospira alstonii serovar Pingchang str. 80-412]|uniref:Uncharacterized protein n=2 Tax=Leptospira alstonii TaxID=28452 RepID=T0H423_9LEPT|nr:hypothetical protein [Leptospira alstonii]EQA80394.1 hypothetical protein LEP1GSC193_0035 [Leptospira alstonii serovar Pingchang str. 80-412]